MSGADEPRSTTLDRGCVEGDVVVLTHLPEGWLDDLPREDQAAITAILGRPIRFSEYDPNHDGYVEVVFVDDRGHYHYLNVRAEFVRRARI